MKKIVLTGGGTAGHVTPNMALIEKLREMYYDITYIGSLDGIEKGLSLLEKGGLLLVCGSFYVISPAREYLLENL